MACTKKSGKRNFFLPGICLISEEKVPLLMHQSREWICGMKWWKPFFPCRCSVLREHEPLLMNLELSASYIRYIHIYIFYTYIHRKNPGAFKSGSEVWSLFADVKFTTSDLLNWKLCVCSHQENPGGNYQLLETIMLPHRPGWGEMQPILNVLIVQKTKEVSWKDIQRFWGWKGISFWPESMCSL